MFKLIVLDRDGVINEDSPFYIKSPDEWHAIPGSLEAIAKLNRLGYKVAIATNQSGIARNYFTVETLNLIHKKMLAQVAEKGGRIDGIFICPHGPEDNCDCRKPKTGLLLQAARQFNIAPEEMLVIGDSMRDLLAAKAYGAKALLVKTGKGEETLKAKADVPVYANLLEVVDLFVIKN
ncbi:MAG: Histidinol-phosphate phosphatase [uncultured bacterium]|nr:MAG: Histidinol-phosphate phosphatase [uncultured bacterium]